MFSGTYYISLFMLYIRLICIYYAAVLHMCIRLSTALLSKQAVKVKGVMTVEYVFRPNFKVWLWSLIVIVYEIHELYLIVLIRFHLY